ncbi:MAG: PhoH family protein [Candidatus Woesearchaeota archaeon]
MDVAYDRVIVARPDIFESGGDGIFQDLTKNGGKNLVVITQESLGRLKLVSNDSLGARATLGFLEHQVTVSSHPGSSHKKGGKLGQSKFSADLRYSIINENVDLVLVKGHHDKDIPGLIRKLGEHYETTGGSSPVVMTNDRADSISLKFDGVIVEKPGFLTVSSEIVNEWAVVGNDELLARLRQSESPLPLEQVVEILGGNLRLNQFVKFISKDPEYARVEGDLRWDRERTEIRDVDNLRLRLLGDREKSRKIRLGNHVSQDLLGVTPKDMGQYLALQYGLLNPDISTFFLCGSHGSGKTLLAYAAAIEQILWYGKPDRQKRGLDPEGKGGIYDRIVLLKPNQTLGGKKREVGALPGTLFDKLRDHLSCYIDAHRETALYQKMPFEDLLRHPTRGNHIFDEPRITKEIIYGGSKAHFPPHTEIMEMTYSGVMFGRSFRNTLILIDEAQNFEPYELKVIIERLGLGCKVVVMGDPWQANGEHVSTEINGLTSGMAHYLDTHFTASLTLGRNYRSQASKHAKTWRTF